jgi:hypothetical protein
MMRSPAVPANSHLKRSLVATAGTLSLLILAALSAPAIAQEHADASGNGKQASWYGRSKQIAQKLFYVHISPPQSGVKLIEEVFQRVRSSPEIALTMQGRRQLLQKMGTQNDNLAIRPPQSGQVVMQPSPSLQLLAQAPEAKALTRGVRPAALPGTIMGRNVDQITDSQFTSLSAASAPSSSPSGASRGVSVAAAPPAVDAWIGNKRYANDEVVAQKQAGVWDRNSVEQAAAASRELDDAEKSVASDLSSLTPGGGGGAVGGSMPYANGNINAKSRERAKWYNAPSELQSSERAASPQPKPPSLLTATARMVALGNAIDRITNGNLTPPQEAAVEESLKKMTYAGKDKAETIAYSGRKDSDYGASFGAAQSQALRSASARTASMKKASTARKSANGPMQTELESVSLSARDRKIAMGEPNIAVLPPNVFTGIPLVRLGIPESQANSALNAIGTTREQRVDNWRVMSWQKNTSKTQTALQLYVRNGLLDAMRIFDPSLIGPEFGINMGDGLTRVKEKFGEPAFILSEPVPGAGKNYIYPVSQVGFQLVPSQVPGEEPRVASVLLFNVK